MVFSEQYYVSAVCTQSVFYPFKWVCVYIFKPLLNLMFYNIARVKWNLSTSCKILFEISHTHTQDLLRWSTRVHLTTTQQECLHCVCVCVFTLLKRRPRGTETSPVEIYSVTAVFTLCKHTQTTAQVCVNIPIHNLLGGRIAVPKHRLPHTHFLRWL